MIKNIIFDFGAVLVDWDRHYLYDDYFKTQEARELFERNTGRKGLTYLEMSNWAAATFDKYVGPNFPVFQLLEGMVVSGHEFCIKPDEKIYRLLLDRYNLKPEESVFVDDSIPNLEGAARLGIHTYHFTNAATFKADLDKIINND